MPDLKKILFVCVENAGRSQMAEGFFRNIAPHGFEPESAGTRPIDSISPLAVEVMREIGIDIAKQRPKVLSEDMIKNSYRIVNMGCMDKESCPALFVGGILDWNIEDPKGKTLDRVRTIRDDIRKKVEELVSTLES
ncbi:MAG TPA: arsenate reductase ArsC [Candidatus Nitrosotalea sp.]|nr:arsenate reductase ArsC [Candidatus Nitrosotalea sp.]